MELRSGVMKTEREREREIMSPKRSRSVSREDPIADEDVQVEETTYKVLTVTCHLDYYMEDTEVVH
jgi:hypothetical protein